MRTAEQIRIDFYGKDDARAHCHDELSIMEDFASEQSEERAIGFAEWILDNRWTPTLNRETFERKFSYKPPEIKSSKELYQLFLKDRVS